MAGSKALTVRARALYGHLTDEKQRTFLIESRGIQEFFERCEKILDLPEHVNGRSLIDFEIAVQKREREDERSLRHFMDFKERNFFDAFLLYDEIEDLKLYLRLLLHTDRSGAFEFLKKSELARAMEWEIPADAPASKFIEKLTDRPYYRVFVPYAGQKDAELLDKLEYIEINLDRWYYSNLMRNARALPRSVQESMKRMIATSIDLDNILRIQQIREKDTPSASNALLLTTGGRRLRYDVAVSLIEGDKRRFADWIQNSAYWELAGEDEPVDYRYLLKRRRFEAREMRRLLRISEGIPAAVACRHLLRVDRNDLIRIAEGVELGLKPDEIRDYLVYTETGEEIRRKEARHGG